MADGVLLLVDAAEGPMPQTRFVLDKALQLGLLPIVVINKIDKPEGRPDGVLDQIFDLFVELNASDSQLDFATLYASGRDGWVSTEPDAHDGTVVPLMDAIIEHVPAPPLRLGPVQMQVTTLDYSDYVGRIGIGRVHRGTLAADVPMVLIKPDGSEQPADVRQIFAFEGLGRVETDVVECGDLCAIVGVTEVDIGDTVSCAETAEALPAISVDEPTLSMVFRVNDSPLAGRDGTHLSSRHLRERLFKEMERDVALRVEEMGGDAFKVSGRGMLHLSILIETMRREGYEMAVARPHVIFHPADEGRQEPIEVLWIDVPGEAAGKVIELAGVRRGEMISIEETDGRQFLQFHIPTRGLIGLRSKVMTASNGEAVMNHRFLEYGAYRGALAGRPFGVLVSMDNGPAAAYAIDGLQQRGNFFIEPNEVAYEGMVVGEHCKDGDLVVNVQKGKQLTNVRASGSDRSMKIAPPIKLSLEEALEFIEEDELLEVTPENMRLRKRELSEHERRRSKRSAGRE
jgi:GTP-binding protein